MAQEEMARWSNLKALAERQTGERAEVNQEQAIANEGLRQPTILVAPVP